MNAYPLTPTLTRKSLKKIIISSPSQEIVRFLNLPNPSANEDPRERIHILTPKSKHRSLSKSDHSQLKPSFQLKIQSKGFNRDCFIRKKNTQVKKTNIQFRSDKLTIKSPSKRPNYLMWKSHLNQQMQHKRFDVTFGSQQFWNCIKV